MLLKMSNDGFEPVLYGTKTWGYCGALRAHLCELEIQIVAPETGPLTGTFLFYVPADSEEFRLCWDDSQLDLGWLLLDEISNVAFIADREPNYYTDDDSFYLSPYQI